MTVETKMSQMETRFDKLEDILHTLVKSATIGKTATPPNASNSAESVSSGSAAGG